MSGAAVQIDHPDAAVDVQQQPDGSVVVNLDTHRREARQPGPDDDKFSANLADRLGKQALDSISQRLLEGIDADIRSRDQWLKNYEKGMELLGLQLEEVENTNDGTVSRVRHPLLLWSIIKFQSITQGELLPADGPCKIENDGDEPDQLAEDLEQSFNYYFKVRDSDYYPDTDRAIFYMGYGGTIFKKVYRDPLLRRPVSRAVYLPDLIISQGALSLETALRVTHKIEMSHQQVLRYQRIKFWRDVELAMPTQRVTSTDEAEARFVTGISPNLERQEDWPHTLYECYANLNLNEWDFKEKGKAEDDELPYRVTIDVDSREILEVRRDWREGDSSFQRRRRFSMWGMIPALGFLCLGFLHLLGNHTKALTALERIIIDGGMFANFPSGVRVKGLRMETNVLRPKPGEFPEIDTGDLPINQAIMALPFKGPTAEILQLMQGLEDQGEKTAGQVDIETGEGRTNVPVGTIMAMIEQSTQVMTAIHRRLHQAQREELQMLRELLCEQPDLLTIPGKTNQWTAEQLADASLVPASDPNIPAHVHRIMQAVVLETLAGQHPELYNQYAVQKRILDIARINHPEEVLIPPEILAMQAQAAAGAQQAPQAGAAPGMDPSAVAIATGELKLQGAKQQTDAQIAAEKNKIAMAQLAEDAHQHDDEMREQALDRVSREVVGQHDATTTAALSSQEAEQEANLKILGGHIDKALQPPPEPPQTGIAAVKPGAPGNG